MVEKHQKVVCVCVCVCVYTIFPQSLLFYLILTKARQGSDHWSNEENIDRLVSPRYPVRDDSNGSSNS